MILEKMGEFFDARLDEYEEHQLTCIESAKEFYPFTAENLPDGEVNILDLGCGTGLELTWYFDRAPHASVTGIDMAPGMLKVLKERFKDKKLTVIEGSYFDVPLGKGVYDAAVSVESLHHFTREEKIPLYTKVQQALKDGAYFLITDYFAPGNEEEKAMRAEYERLKKEQGLKDGEFYHYDTPLTVTHEMQALFFAGFATVEVLGNWADTYTIKAQKFSAKDIK